MTRSRPMILLPLAIAFAITAFGTATVHAMAATADTMRLSVMPSPTHGQAGDTLLVELRVPVAGPAFNGYDAYLAYDPAALQFLPAANVATQEGPLMTAACGLRFHVFEADTLAGNLRISQSLLCAGRSVTGPGVVYRVKLRCRNVNVDTRLDLLLEAPHRTVFFLAGTALQPLAVTGATVRVGNGSAAGSDTPQASSSALRIAPNPFNPAVEILLSLAEADDATVRVFDVHGRLVAAPLAGPLPAGETRLTWRGRDDDGRALPSGTYLFVLETSGGRRLVSRGTLLR